MSAICLFRLRNTVVQSFLNAHYSLVRYVEEENDSNEGKRIFFFSSFAWKSLAIFYVVSSTLKHISNNLDVIEILRVSERRNFLLFFSFLIYIIDAVFGERKKTCVSVITHCIINYPRSLAGVRTSNHIKNNVFHFHNIVVLLSPSHTHKRTHGHSLMKEKNQCTMIDHKEKGHFQ